MCDFLRIRKRILWDIGFRKVVVRCSLFSDRLLARRADGRLLHTVSRQSAELRCSTIDVCTLSRWMAIVGEMSCTSRDTGVIREVYGS